MWYIYATPSYLYCWKQLWINYSYMSICVQNCVRCNWLWCFGNTAIQPALDSPHKRPLSLRLNIFFVVSMANIWNYNRIAGVEKIIMCYFVYIFIKIQSSPTNSNFLREINHDYNLMNFSLRLYVLSSSLLGRLVLILPPHKPCDVFALPGDRFTATEVFYQHANIDVQVEWTMIYHSNNSTAYNQVKQKNRLNFNWDMLGVSPYL